MIIASRIDTVIINIILPENESDVQAGIDAHAYRLLDAFSNYALLFSVLLLPLFSRMIKQKDNVMQLAKLAFTLLFSASVIIAVNTCFYSREITGLLYNNHIDQSAALLQIIMFAFIPVSTTYVFGSLLTANGSLKYLNIVYVFSVLISLILNIILIPSLLAKGSGIANLSAQLFAAIAQVFIAVKIFRFNFNIKFVISLLVFVSFVFLMNLFASYLTFNWAVEFLAISLVSFVFVLIMRLLNMKEIVKIIKEKQE
jgi:O-antigen/teichoic acid export membrane protein